MRDLAPTPAELLVAALMRLLPGHIRTGAGVFKLRPAETAGKEKEESYHGPALPLPLAVHAPTVLRRPPPVVRAVRQPPLDPREREEERERR